jgi:quinol monooxygenase YgiN
MTESPVGRYGLVVRFEVAASHEDAFDALTAETLGGIRSSEMGTLMYVVHREPAAPSVRVFYELYRDEAAFDAHEQMPHVRRFLSERAQHLTGDPVVWRISPTAGVVRPVDGPDHG